MEDLIREIFGPNTEINKQVVSQVQVHLISIDFPTLRGFSGMNELFINEKYFSNKISEWKLNPQQLDPTMKMDLITIGLHECAHVRIRQVSSRWESPPPYLLFTCERCSSPFV